MCSGRIHDLWPFHLHRCFFQSPDAISLPSQRGAQNRQCFSSPRRTLEQCVFALFEKMVKFVCMPLCHQKNSNGRICVYAIVSSKKYEEKKYILTSLNARMVAAMKRRCTSYGSNGNFTTRPSISSSYSFLLTVFVLGGSKPPPSAFISLSLCCVFNFVFFLNFLNFKKNKMLLTEVPDETFLENRALFQLLVGVLETARHGKKIEMRFSHQKQFYKK